VNGSLIVQPLLGLPTGCASSRRQSSRAGTPGERSISTGWPMTRVERHGRISSKIDASFPIPSPNVRIYQREPVNFAIRDRQPHR